MVYYNQTDARWGNKMYGKSGTIGADSCGPTALAIAVASLTSNKVTPYDVWLRTVDAARGMEATTA